jgi:hypothetical protein
MTDQRMLFPEPAKNASDYQERIEDEGGEHTFAMNPQESANRFPIRKDPAPKEPLSGSIMLNAARDVVVC